MEIVRSLHLVAQALQNDLDTMQSLLDPPVPQPQVDDSEIRSMFERLRADEAVSSDGKRPERAARRRCKPGRMKAICKLLRDFEVWPSGRSCRLESAKGTFLSTFGWRSTGLLLRRRIMSSDNTISRRRDARRPVGRATLCYDLPETAFLP